MKARVLDWFSRWHPYLTLMACAAFAVPAPYLAFIFLAWIHWQALDALRVRAVAPPNAPTPRDKVAEFAVQAVEEVRFDKMMIGEGFAAQRRATVRARGKPDVFILVTSEREFARMGP